MHRSIDLAWFAKYLRRNLCGIRDGLTTSGSHAERLVRLPAWGFLLVFCSLVSYIIAPFLARDTRQTDSLPHVTRQTDERTADLLNPSQGQI